MTASTDLLASEAPSSASPHPERSAEGAPSKDAGRPASGTKTLPLYCYQCVAGPDLMTVEVKDGVATRIGPNPAAADTHPGGGRVCVKAYGLIQKTYNPHRIRQPMRRTNPRKGRHEDPGFVPISWDEALDLVAGKLGAIRAKGLTDESGYPRATTRSTSTASSGTAPSSWRPTPPMSVT
jgi:phenylacetyl-CoA:acceptor oxidoreductase